MQTDFFNTFLVYQPGPAPETAMILLHAWVIHLNYLDEFTQINNWRFLSRIRYWMYMCNIYFARSAEVKELDSNSLLRFTIFPAFPKRYHVSCETKTPLSLFGYKNMLGLPAHKVVFIFFTILTGIFKSSFLKYFGNAIFIFNKFW